MLDLADSIEDPELQRKYLIKIRDLITKEESNMMENNKEYGMKNVLEKFKKEKKSSNVTIKDLQEEIGKIKREIKKLKNNNKLIKNIVLGESSKGKEKLEINVEDENSDSSLNDYLNVIERIKIQKWIIRIKLKINNSYTLN